MTTVALSATIRRHVIKHAGMVGQIVTVDDRMYMVHSIEGTDWYAFDQDGQTTIDDNMTRASWLTEPLVTVVPLGCKMGDGFSSEFKLSRVRLGVSLVK